MTGSRQKEVCLRLVVWSEPFLHPPAVWPPLLLLMLGVSGAWIGNLTALEPYKPLFATVALIFIGMGFWLVYFKTKPACDDGSYCARPESALITKAALWFSTVLVGLALTINWWAPLFY
ncbi:mercuric transporter MerT family protein [Thalassospira indica]|uniref:mercuric transporter MerT family protein n=1 Tax=Thalassospira indica TaxID=1891279 RepID=UPI001E341F8B|tara:strand:- start:452 stop:808 length:357 start_codon:yes stop_codon:yes gene_type:complete